MVIILGFVPEIVWADQPTNSPSFTETMKRWQDKMTREFQAAFARLAKEQQTNSLATASVDLREQKDSYTVRLNLPGRNIDGVEVTLKGEMLHILAPDENGFGRYEQNVTLAGVKPDCTTTIERNEKDHVMVITVPKLSAEADRHSPLLPELFPPVSGNDEIFFRQMEGMRRQMDRDFDEAFRNFSSGPEWQGFFDEPRFDSMYDLQTEGTNYVVRAYLPERNMKNINVTVSGTTVKIEAKAV